MFSSATTRFSDDLSYAMVNSDDPETVREAAPAYLLMMDALIKNNPESVSMLRSAARLNTGYSEIFVQDTERAKNLTEKGLSLAIKAACLENRVLCGLREKDFDKFRYSLLRTDENELSTLFVLGGAWAAWIQANKQDWNAIAEISRVEVIMNRVIEMNPEFEDGGAYLYLGALATLLPPALGGKPELGQSYFKKAIRLSEGKNLMAKVEYAKRYARLVFDRQLHDRLLNEVLKADPYAKGYVLTNILAQKEARALLDSANDYF